MSNIFDTHCHPQFPQYDKDRDEVLSRAGNANVSMICVGTDLETSRSGIALAQQHKNIWATVGLHPNDNLNERFNADEYEELLKQDKVLAMGEIGLDYYRTQGEQEQKFQRDRFVEQLELAQKLSKPLVLHCRDSKAGSTGRAYPQMIDILKNEYTKNGGVVHSYTGNLNEAKEFLSLGFYLGFNGIITFARQYDEIVIHTPIENILLETDAPYLTPEPYRGQRNEPSYVIEVAQKLAGLKKVTLDKIINVTTQNAVNLFRISK